MKPLLLIAALIFASTAAQAEAQPLSTDLYECTPVYESAGARTVDQVHKTNIAVTRNNESRPIGMSVQHILVSGAVRTRNDQYATRFETDGDQFFRWSGSLNGNQRITMSGSLDRDPRSNGWMYSEKQWDEGHFEWSARSTCHHVVSNATAATTLAQTENNNRFAKNAEASLAAQLLDWYSYHLRWLIYVGAACFIWMFIGLRTLEFVGYPRDTLKSRLITFAPVCISLLFLIFPMFLFLETALDIAGLIFRWMLDPRHWWASLPILAVVWLTSYRSKKPWRNVLAKSLQPWLVGMLIVEAVFFAASLWLPQSQHDKLLWILTMSYNLEVKLEKLSPPLLISLLLLAAIFALNVWCPQLRTWTSRFEKAMELCKSFVPVLAVFTSVTFFGTGAAAALHDLTAQEILKDQATATAQLMLAARVTEDQKTEAADVKAFLNVIQTNVVVDLAFWKSSKFGTISKEKLEQIVRENAQEVQKYEPPLVRDTAMAIDTSKLKAMLETKLTEDQLKDAKIRFDKALDLFLDKGAEITFHPLSEMLSKAGLPGLTTSIVKDLYGAELSRLSKAVIRPLADALWRPRSYEANLAPDALKRAWQRPVFDEKVLPPRIATPTVSRLAEQTIGARIIEETVGEAVREAR